MRTERTLLPRTAALLMLAPAALLLRAQDAAPAQQAIPSPDVPMPVIYGLIMLAVLQVILIISVNGIMRTMGGTGALLKKLAERGARLAVLLPLALFATGDASAQAYAGEGGQVPVYHMMWWLIVTNIILFVVLVAQLSVLRGMTRALIGEDATAASAPVPTGPSWEDRVLQALTRRKSIAEEKDILMHHEYDGIRELDNVLPPWWLWLFYGTVIWGVIYIVNVHVIGVWPDQTTAYKNEMAQAQAEVDAFLSAQASQVDERNVALLTDAGTLASGAGIYKQNCATCHGQLDEGTAGPNLTDAYWLHGGGIKEVFTTIKYGVSGKAMKAWNTDLKPTEMQAVANFVLSLQGTNPPNPKAPEGDLWKGDGGAAPAAPADSTAKAAADSLAAPADTVRLASK